MAKNDFAAKNAKGAKTGRAGVSPVGNLSKARRERLVAEVAEIRAYLEKSAGSDTNATRLLAFAAELEKEVCGKKYGLVFEEHRERVDVELMENIPVLAEDKRRYVAGDLTQSRIDAEALPINFLIEGDNLAALKLLVKTHRGKIDLIYIDPPYNTGNRDFIYNDSYVDKTDTFRHSKWLSFMKKRLEIAKRLMSDKGVIFISIDDNEQAALKLLCDDVLGTDNFVANIAWQRTYSTRNDSKGIVNEVEHILVYSRYIGWQPRKMPRTAEMDKKYKNPDNDPRGEWRSDNAYAPNAATHQGMVYAIQHPFTGDMLYPTFSSCWRYEQSDMLEIMNGWCQYELKDIGDDEKRAEICGVANVRKGVKAIVLARPLEESSRAATEVLKRGQWPRFFFSKNGKGGIARKTYLDNVGGLPPTNLWEYKDVGHTDEAKKELMSIFAGKSPFDTPKPVRLLTRILLIASDKESTILDFFAGSGTTGHAVMKLNAEDGGRRKFILVTNNENEICEKVTYERLKRVIAREKYAAALKYFKVDYVPIGEEGYWDLADKLLGHIRELVELENGIDFRHDKSVAIVLRDEEVAGFVKGLNAGGAHILYKGHNVMLDAKACKAIAKHGVEVRTIPDYYYPELEN